MVFFGRTMPTTWLITVDAVVSIVGLLATVAFWRLWSKRFREPSEIIKMTLGFAFLVGALLSLTAAAAIAISGRKASIGWVLAFGSEYHHSLERPHTFLLDLLHPLADLAVLGALLPVLTAAWRRVLVPYVALLVLTGADSLGVGARISGGHQGILTAGEAIAALRREAEEGAKR